MNRTSTLTPFLPQFTPGFLSPLPNLPQPTPPLPTILPLLLPPLQPNPQHPLRPPQLTIPHPLHRHPSLQILRHQTPPRKIKRPIIMLPLDISMMVQHRARNCEMEFASWFGFRWLHVGGGGWWERERGGRKVGGCGIGGEGFCGFGGCCGNLSGFGVGYGSCFGESFESFKGFFYRHMLRARSSGLIEFFLGFVFRHSLSEWSLFNFGSPRSSLLLFLFFCRSVFGQR